MTASLQGTSGLRWIDGFVNTPMRPEDRPGPRDPNTTKWFKNSPAYLKGTSMAEMIADMNAAGITKAILVARSGWHNVETKPRSWTALSHGVDDEIFDSYCAEAAESVAANPGRLYGSAMLDPMGGMRTVRQMERAVRDYGFVCLRMMPAATGIAPDDPLCYPIYTKAIELGIPLTINVGFPGPMRPADTQRPILLDRILLTYPELVIVGTHIGFPWHLETLALLQKHPNFYLMTSGWAPRYIPSEIVHFMNTRGADKVMWASDFPVLPIQRTVDEALELPLKDDVLRGYVGANAEAVFRLS